MPFAEEILLVDDTSCTNKFNYPIIIAIGLDENRISQLIVFGIIPGKSPDNFEQFFEQLSPKYSVRVFVCDRLRSQSKSIKKYFSSHIIYCKIHIRRNIISYFNSDLLESFNKLLIHEISKDEFLNILKNVKTETVEGQKHLKYLIKDIDSYSPEVLDEMRLPNVRTTNGVESFFGTYKKLNDHEILTIDQCVHSIVLRYKMLISKSLSIKKIAFQKNYIYKGRQIGEEAMTIIKEQYDKMFDKIQLIFLNKLSEKEYLTSCKCSLYKEFGLPCEHILFQSYKKKNHLLKKRIYPKYISKFNMKTKVLLLMMFKMFLFKKISNSKKVIHILKLCLIY